MLQRESREPALSVVFACHPLLRQQSGCFMIDASIMSLLMQYAAEVYTSSANAFRRVGHLSSEVPAMPYVPLMMLRQLRGVVTHSSGNHAAALSLAAKLRGIPAYVVIPKNAPKCKVNNVIRYGGQVIWSEVTMKSREDTALKVSQETGAVLIHPYNDKRIISGQGTISVELLEQAPQLDTIIVPISGGGLISGVALASKSMNPTIRVLAAEPRGANDAAQSKAAGRIITLPVTNTVADGLRASLGDLTWPVVRDLVDDVIVVDDTDIVEAMRLCYEILKVAVEPSGAIGLAAVLSESFRSNPAWKDCNHIGIILSGGHSTRTLGCTLSSKHETWTQYDTARGQEEMFLANSMSSDCTGANRHLTLSSVEVGNAQGVVEFRDSIYALVTCGERVSKEHMYLPQVQKMILTPAQRNIAQQNRKVEANIRLIPSSVSCTSRPRELLDCPHMAVLRASEISVNRVDIGDYVVRPADLDSLSNMGEKMV
ncbi:hypothetical protein NL676_011266 [Syzygium grande]|nr:hypothetical protein NL676_011266 [Syzygium grande]